MSLLLSVKTSQSIVWKHSRPCSHTRTLTLALSSSSSSPSFPTHPSFPEYRAFKNNLLDSLHPPDFTTIPLSVTHSVGGKETETAASMELKEVTQEKEVRVSRLDCMKPATALSHYLQPIPLCRPPFAQSYEETTSQLRHTLGTLACLTPDNLVLTKGVRDGNSII